MKLRKRFVVSDTVRRLTRAAKAACVLAAAAICLATAFTVTAAHAETRTLKLYNTHTKERVSITFKKNGRYLAGGLREANRFLRDWRRNEITKIDPELLDLIWEVYRKVGGREHIYVVSSYRSPATNNMLRKRSSGVAKNSQHTLGKAMDFYIPGVNLAKLRATGLRKEVGGVGYYPRSGSPFVHMDTGRIRHWPRMSRSQLAKVFPNGKTLHIPSDGKPLSGYKLALAESKSGTKRRSTRPTIVASNNSKPTTRDQSLTNPSAPIRVKAPEKPSTGGGNLFAGLFNRGKAKDDDTGGRPGAVGNKPTPPAPIQVALENPPVPARKFVDEPAAAPVPDAEAIVVASAAPVFKPQDDTASAPAVATASAAPSLPFSVAASAPPSNTLDAQKVALDSGQKPLAEEAIDSRFQVARAPGQKPTDRLSVAAREAAENLGLTGSVPVPLSAPTDDPVAAIAAATGTAVPSPVPAPRGETTLAYASASAVPASLSRSLRPQASARPRQPASRAASTQPDRPQPSVSGRIPRDQIVDPLAGFASAPDKSEPTLLSGAGTTRHDTFALLSHPNQRALKGVLQPGNRFVAASFVTSPYGGLRTDRFDGGPAVVVLPVRFAR